jgi:hypothetical protein
MENEDELCRICGKPSHLGTNCDPNDLNAFNQLQKMGKSAIDSTLRSATENAAALRAQFAQYLNMLKTNQATIDKMLEDFERVIWHLCILNRLNYEMDFRDLGISLLRL